MSNRTVAIILASYNGAKYIGEQIRSILQQQDVEIDLFIYDDCSSDNTVRIIKDLSAQNSRIFLIERQLGSGSAFKNFNLAIKEFDASRYDYIAFCDQDDIWLPEKLKTQISTIEAESLAGCSSSVEAFYTDGKVTYIDNAGSQTVLDFAFQGGGQGCTYVLTQTYFLALQQLVRTANQLDIPHDWLAYSLARTHGLKWKILTQPLIRYRQHDNVFGARSGLSGLRSRFSMLISKNFQRGRVALSNLLAEQNPENLPLRRLKMANNFGRRLAFAWRYHRAFRRSDAHSLAMAVMYVAGYA